MRNQLLNIFRDITYKRKFVNHNFGEKKSYQHVQNLINKLRLLNLKLWFPG